MSMSATNLRESFRFSLFHVILFSFQATMNGPVYASSCPALQSNLSLHSSSYYSEYSGTTRRRLSSTGEADTSATSSYEGSDSSENSDESRLDPVSQMEREQLETFFRGLKSQVSLIGNESHLHDINYLGNNNKLRISTRSHTGVVRRRD